MELEHGTREEHIETLQRAKENNVTRIWTGDLRRNSYLRENLLFGKDEGFLEITSMDTEYEQQESFFIIEWKMEPKDIMLEAQS